MLILILISLGRVLVGGVVAVLWRALLRGRDSSHSAWNGWGRFAGKGAGRGCWPIRHGPSRMAHLAWPIRHGPSGIAHPGWPIRHCSSGMGHLAWPLRHGPSRKPHPSWSIRHEPSGMAKPGWPIRHGARKHRCATNICSQSTQSSNSIERAMREH